MPAWPSGPSKLAFIPLCLCLAWVGGCQRNERKSERMQEDFRSSAFLCAYCLSLLKKMCCAVKKNIVSIELAVFQSTSIVFLFICLFVVIGRVTAAPHRYLSVVASNGDPPLPRTALAQHNTNTINTIKHILNIFKQTNTGLPRI